MRRQTEHFTESFARSAKSNVSFYMSDVVGACESERGLVKIDFGAA